jgi:hypothetical protein
METTANLPPGLQALLSASQELGISMTAPGPQGEQPTVASQILQQAGPQMQGIKQQAGIGAQIQAQQQAQKQKAAQDPDEIARRVAMMMQQGGIGALPVAAQFADGGIIGYNGEEDDLEELLYGELEYSGFQPVNTPEPVRPAAPLARFERVRVMTPAELATYQATGNEPSIEVIRQRIAEGAPPAAAAGEYADETTRPPGAVPPRPRPEGDAGYTVDRRSSGSADPQVNIPTGQAPVRPTYSEITQGIGPLADFQSAVDRMRNIENRRERFLADQQALEPQGVAALERAQAAREALAAKERKNDSINRLQGWFRDLYTRGNSQEMVANGIKVREEQLIQGRLNTENAKRQLQMAQQEREAGRFDRQLSAEARAYTMENEASKNFIQAAQVAANLSGSIYGAELKSYNDRVLGNAQLLVEIAKVRVQADANQQTKLSNAMNATQSRLNDALGKIQKAVEQRYGSALNLANLATKDGKVDPQLQQTVKDAATYQTQLEQQYGVPEIRAEVDAVRAQLAGTPGRTTRYDNRGNPAGAKP